MNYTVKIPLMSRQITVFRPIRDLYAVPMRDRGVDAVASLSHIYLVRYERLPLSLSSCLLIEHFRSGAVSNLRKIYI